MKLDVSNQRNILARPQTPAQLAARPGCIVETGDFMSALMGNGDCRLISQRTKRAGRLLIADRHKQKTQTIDAKGYVLIAWIVIPHERNPLAPHGTCLFLMVWEKFFSESIDSQTHNRITYSSTEFPRLNVSQSVARRSASKDCRVRRQFSFAFRACRIHAA